jgi:hypothetical protein
MRRPFLLLSLCVVPALANWLQMSPVPIDRLMSITESAIRQNANDAEAHCVLGRLHSLAFAMRTEAQAVLRDGKISQLIDPTPTSELPKRESSSKLKPADIDHANKSVANYQRAVGLAPDVALYHFSLGWMQQQCSRYADQLGSHKSDEWIDLALAEYRAAYRLALPDDRKERARLRPYLTEQAGSAIVEILKRRSGNEKEIDEITAMISELRGHTQAITPVIFSLNPRAKLADLVSSARVKFDLDGFDAGREWSWVRPETLILVWDPERTGRITSGRQLFGGVTWWMFWRNGYEPLAMLDDNRDGILEGAELRGIAVWRDANSNGVADPGEVIPVEEFGIVEIAVRPREVDRTLECAGGIKLKDGTSLPTFDWVSHSSEISRGSQPASLHAAHR